jgi:malate dehydrogenase
MSKVTVIGAGKYGSTTTQRIAAMDIADEVVLADIVDGLPQGLALDMNQSRPLERYRTKVIGANGYAETADSDVVVITAGRPRTPGMSRMDLLEVNAKIVADVTRQIMAHSENPVIIVVTNPLDHMTTLAAEVSGLPRERVIGQAGNLDSARFAHFIAEKADADVLTVDALTLGSHGETMVPVPSQCRVGSRPLTEVFDTATIADLVDRTRKGGAEVISYLKTGSAYYAPSSAASIMVKAVLEDSGARMPVCAWTTGQYGISDVYLGVPARIGAGGVREIVELPLTDSELADLRAAAGAVQAKVDELHSLDLD